LTNPGTYWYHAHNGSQSADGLRGLLTVRHPSSPYKDQYDEELVLSVSDWYHEQMTDRLGSGDKNSTIADLPAPDSTLLNDAHGARIQVTPGATYLVRVANIGAMTGKYFRIMDHEMVIVEVDGVYTKPQMAAGIHLAPGQRFSLLMATKNDTSANYPIITTMDSVRFRPPPRSISLILRRPIDLTTKSLRLVG
jgi:iron transport multicopper oxidase